MDVFYWGLSRDSWGPVVTFNDDLGPLHTHHSEVLRGVLVLDVTTYDS